VILATACTAIALLSTSCGGGGSSALVSVPAPSFSLSSTTINFGNQGVNSSSGPLTVTLTNVGDATLTFSVVQVTGPNAGDFSLTNHCGSSLAASAQCTLAAAFAPSAAGIRTGSVVFTDNAASSPQSLNLTGTGTAPGVGLSATSLTFGSQLVGTSSPAQTLTLANNGNSALGITSLVVTGANPGDFLETTTCGSSVAAGGSCAISVTFTPTAPGSRAATVTIADNAIGSPQTVNLAGTGTSPAVSLTPASLAFASQNVGTTSAPQSVTLNNTGTATLSISGITMMGANPGDFIETTTCGPSVGAGDDCTITVTFTPSSAGTRTASVMITDNASDSVQAVSLTGTGLSGQANLSPSSLTFASQNVGTTSAAQSITLSNTGNTSFNVTSISTTGTNAGDFSATTTCGSSVTAGGNCTISVTFTPTATGTRTAAVSISDNAAGGPQTVILTGTGSAPIASLTATSLSFSGQDLGTTSASQTFTLNNTGNQALTITSLGLSGANPGDYGETTTCGSSVAACGSCTISVTFTPTATGTRTAALTVTDNSNNVAGSTQTVNLTGTGAGPVASLTPSTLTFGIQTLNSTSAAQSITLTNTGNASLTIASISVTGTNAGDFAQRNTCGSSVGASGNCTISVTFTPTAISSRTASISIADSATTSPQSVTLTGTGTASVVSLSVASLNFGNQAVNTTSASQTVTLTNTGNLSLAITSISITGANSGDFSQSNTCGSAVAAGGSCAITVTFTPSASGSRTASVSIADNATAGSPQVVSLAGTGTSGTVGFSATALTFGNQAVGTSSAAQVVTLTNGGGSILTISNIQLTGTNSADFGESNNCGGSMAANGNCTINVTFSPGAPGSRTAILTANDNASGSPQTVNLTGTGTAPTASLSPSSLAFASQPAATSSSPQTFALANTGNAALDIASIAFAGANASDFSQSATCGATLAANSNCTIAVLFTPGASGSRSASLTVTDNSNGGSGSTQSSTLTGTGSHDVILSWTASPASGVVGYGVYRGTTSGGESSTPLNSTPINGTTYVDANVTAGVTYYYVVTAVGSDGVQSAASNETEATVPTP
jgi:hypothetical protein